MLDHVTQEERAAAVQQVKSLEYKWQWKHDYPNLHCFLGLVHRGMTNYIECREDEKEFTQYLKKAAAIFAEQGMKTIEICMGKAFFDDTPELEVGEAHLQPKDFECQCYADAGTCVVETREKRKYYLGLGGVIRKGDVIAAKFQVRVEVPIELFNSTVGEHLAHIVLVKVAKMNDCRKAGFFCDNNSIPAHLDGDFACNTKEINVIRRTTYELLVGMESTRGWLPRLKNKESDQLAKEAAHGKYDPSQYQEESFKEMREALKNAIAEVKS